MKGQVYILHKIEKCRRDPIEFPVIFHTVHEKNMSISTNDFKELIGEELSGVTFVRSYLQLQFLPPPLLNILTPVTVRSEGEISCSGDESFANKIIGQINKVIKYVDFKESSSLDLYFEDGSSISISLRHEDYIGAEAINLFLRDKSMVVI